MSINDIKSKIKSFGANWEGRDLYVVFIIIVAAFGSFGLGRLSKGSLGPKPIQILYDGKMNLAAVAESQTSQPSLDRSGYLKSGTSNQYVASKKGKKYYPVDCAAGESLKTENKIYFNSEKEALQAGYSASASC